MTHRKLAVAVAAAALLTFPVTALAEPVQSLTIKASPSKAGTSSKPRSVTMSVSLGTTDPTGAQPPTTSNVVLFFPAGSRYNGNLFPTCSATTIAASKSTADCPSGSIIGTGSAAGQAAGGINQNDLKITAANGGRNKVNLFVEGSSPLRIQSNIIGTLSPASGLYGLKLNVPVPQTLQEPTAGVKVAITKFAVTIGKSRTVKGKKRGILEITKCAGTWSAKGDFTYTDGVPAKTVTTSQKCTK